MITHPDFAARAARTFGDFLEGGAPSLILSHDDADGLSSAALLGRGTGAPVRLVGRGLNAWTDPVAEEVAGEALVVADLGMRDRMLGRRLCVIDHHVPAGRPEGAAMIHGEGLDPVPSASLLAWWALGAPEDRLWLAALGCMGDYGDKGGHAEVAPAKKRYGAGKLRELTSLVNAPRRSAAGDGAPALALLAAAEDPADALSGRHPGLAECEGAREEVKAAAAEARRAPPRFGARYGGDLAVVRIDTPCQVHPLTAQSWVGRLRGATVLCANFGFLPGMVSFSGRAPEGGDIPALLARHRPEGADPALYGNGHRRAAGGTLPRAAWNALMGDLGFGPELRA
ncbi:single-stranded-DNA-specific exonuclease [Hasllibacter halocynthiae]|uniref:Single-stranded-DNA-specific exonuclease n=1 Tax=Hasllibacter halocynthiae TaxID=595589 RepID=A0A2T0X337_9RHOB|nr:hypothetical protein [Hasllibacter halocynthiae]PRY93350.1 single-stranded-DNA-specific exonuclease [Hasllibacter halocynthiae]